MINYRLLRKATLMVVKQTGKIIGVIAGSAAFFLLLLFLTSTLIFSSYWFLAPAPVILTLMLVAIVSYYKALYKADLEEKKKLLKLLKEPETVRPRMPKYFR